MLLAVLVASPQPLRVGFLRILYPRHEWLEQPAAVKNGGDQYALRLDALVDPVAVHKSFANQFVANLRNNAS